MGQICVVITIQESYWEFTAELMKYTHFCEGHKFDWISVCVCDHSKDPKTD